ncbi:unnamed protein product [Arabis nemorensis]|uniref:S-locus receptor kinase C-terminal domain-containing protein n=1 Tax=Arabis nemorensis TaxID=586526 RepID=A0A565APK4_9BRAS|nr:unnamed protein product [Arabis nemorensis]
MKCIHIGLLSVQENASDRLDMSSVVFMLGHNAIDLPSPKHPAFTVGRKRSVKNAGSLVSMFVCLTPASAAASGG